jgi:hypothetical protein
MPFARKVDRSPKTPTVRKPIQGRIAAKGPSPLPAPERDFPCGFPSPLLPCYASERRAEGQSYGSGLLL